MFKFWVKLLKLEVTLTFSIGEEAIIANSIINLWC